MLGQQCEVEVKRVINEGMDNQVTRRRDEGGRGPLHPFGGNEVSTNGPVGDVKLGVRVDVDVDVEETVVAEEEAVPERGKGEVGVGEEGERDFGFRVDDGEEGRVGEDGGIRGGGEDGLVEEVEVVELILEGDGGLAAARGGEAEVEEEEEESEKPHK